MKNKHPQTRKPRKEITMSTDIDTPIQNNNNVTLDIINEFQEQIDVDKVYSLKEMKDILSDIFKVKNMGKKITTKTVKKSKKTVTSDDEMETDSDNEIKKKKGRPVKVKLDKDGNEKQKRAPTAYNKFVGERIKSLKQENPDTKAVELMKMASAEWKEMSVEQKESYKNK